MAPPKSAQILVALFTPPASREEVLGDLHERCTSAMQYYRDAIRTVPLVILSRIRRTADPQLMLMHALVLYLSYSTVTWFVDRPMLHESWSQWRLAVPCTVTLLGMILEDAYARPGRRSALRLARGPLLGVAWALLLKSALGAGHSGLALPLGIALYGGALGLLLTSALRLLFSPPSTSPQGRI